MTFPTAAATITRRKSFGTAAAMVVLLLLKPKYLSAKLVGLSSVFSDPPDKLAGCYRQCVMSSSPGAEQLDGQEPPAIRNRVGGAVTRAVLPHHRTCGSAYGGSCDERERTAHLASLSRLHVARAPISTAAGL